MLHVDFLYATCFYRFSDYLLPCFMLSKAKATLSMPDITKYAAAIYVMIRIVKKESDGLKIIKNPRIRPMIFVISVN